MTPPPMRWLTLLLALLLLGGVGFLGMQVMNREAPGPRSSRAEAPLERLEPGSPAAPTPAASYSETPETVDDDGEASRLNREAIEHLEAERFEEAVELFERCTELSPGEPIFVANLAEGLARLAVYQHDVLVEKVLAIATLERAVELAPDREELARLLEHWRKEAEAEAEFARIETEHFVIRFDYLRSELSEEFYMHGDLERLLESTYHEFGEAFAHYPVEEGRAKIEVVIYGREAFDEVTGLGHWAGGVYDGTVRVPVDSLASSEKTQLGHVLRHELLHAFTADVGGDAVPGWLGEGLAQWIERRGGATARAARLRLRGIDLFPLDRLQGSLATWQDPEDIGLAYAQSLAFVDHLVDQYGPRLPFRMVEAIGQGKDPETAFRELTLGLQLDAALEDLGLAVGAR